MKFMRHLAMVLVVFLAVGAPLAYAKDDTTATPPVKKVKKSVSVKKKNKKKAQEAAATAPAETPKTA